MLVCSKTIFCRDVRISSNGRAERIPPHWRKKPLSLSTTFRLFLALILLSHSALIHASDFPLWLGAVTNIAIPIGLEKVAISDPQVIGAQPDGRGTNLVVRGLAAGGSELQLTSRDGVTTGYHVTVRPNWEEMRDQLATLLADVEGLELKIVGERIVLFGALLTKAGYDKVTKIAEVYADNVLNLTTLDRSELNEFIAAALTREINRPTVKVHLNGETAVLEGRVYDQADINRALEIVKLHIPNVLNLLQVEEVMIETDICFVQVDKNSSRNRGNNILENMTINAGANYSGNPEGGTLSYHVGNSLVARIHDLIGAGSAHIVAEPHISAKSGGMGEFHSGGEVYFEVTGIADSKMVKIEYGIILMVRPILRGADCIVSEITIEVSMPSQQTRGNFSLEQFKTTSTVMCHVGESILLSGLNHTLQMRFKEKTPFLGEIPLLKLLFSQQSDNDQSREMVVLLTPRPVFPEERDGPPYSKIRKRILP